MRHFNTFSQLPDQMFPLAEQNKQVQRFFCPALERAYSGKAKQ